MPRYYEITQDKESINGRIYTRRRLRRPDALDV